MNFVLIAADSLRADRISGSGCARATTPFLDSLAARGVRFERATTPVAPTRPACATMLSGQHPLTHGVVGKRWPRRPAAEMASLPETLARAGWSTLSVDSLAGRRCSPWLRRGFGTHVAHGSDGSRPNARSFNGVIREWLRGRGGGDPFFVFVRYCDTHTPYLPARRLRSLFYEGDPTTTNVGSLTSFWERPHRAYFMDEWEKPLREEWPQARGERIEDVEFLRAMYDSCVRSVDEGVEELVEIVTSLGALDETVFVVTADHGESLGEHDVFFGHVGLHEPILRVPCIVAGAPVRAQGRRVDAPIETTDIAPTVLELAGLDEGAGRDARAASTPRSELDGVSLMPWLEGRRPGVTRPRPHLACEATYRAAWALRSGNHKLILSHLARFPTEVYDLAADPGETRNLADERPELRDALAQQLEATLARELSARKLSFDPVARAVEHVHAPREDKSAWRLARRTLRHAMKRAGALARGATGRQLWVSRKGSSRPVATAHTT